MPYCPISKGILIGVYSGKFVALQEKLTQRAYEKRKM